MGVRLNITCKVRPTLLSIGVHGRIIVYDVVFLGSWNYSDKEESRRIYVNFIKGWT